MGTDTHRSNRSRITRAATMILAAASLAVGLAACSSSETTPPALGTKSKQDATPTTTAPPWPEPVFNAGACPMKIPATVEVKVDCGTMDVPENRLDPRSRTITLAVAHLHSRSSSPAEHPVVQLEGGPGFGSLTDIEGYARSKILDRSDYYLWDQRGTGYSTPSLNCPETDEAVWQSFATTDPAETEGIRLEESLRQCKARLVKEGVDLDGYNTIQNAADLADLREALGIDSWDLRGVSYGSALAIETVRTHPEGIHSVLLDSVVVPDEPFGAVARGESALRSFGELRKACNADAACKKTYGDTDELMAKAAAALDAKPYRTTVTQPDTGQARKVAITGPDLYAGLFNAMYDETLIPLIPKVLTQVANGDNAIIDQLAKQSIPFVTDQVEAMTTSVDCADRLRLLDPPSFDRFVKAHPELGALVFLGAAERGCKEWGVKPVPESFNTLLTPKTANDVPILMMAGRFDPITPPEGTERVAKALRRKLWYFPNAGHGAVGSSDCARTIWFAFMDDPSKQPDTSCMADLGPPEFA